MLTAQFIAANKILWFIVNRLYSAYIWERKQPWNFIGTKQRYEFTENDGLVWLCIRTYQPEAEMHSICNICQQRAISDGLLIKKYIYKITTLTPQFIATNNYLLFKRIGWREKAVKKRLSDSDFTLSHYEMLKFSTCWCQEP